MHSQKLNQNGDKSYLHNKEDVSTSVYILRTGILVPDSPGGGGRGCYKNIFRKICVFVIYHRM